MEDNVTITREVPSYHIWCSYLISFSCFHCNIVYTIKFTKLTSMTLKVGQVHPYKFTNLTSMTLKVGRGHISRFLHGRYLHTKFGHPSSSPSRQTDTHTDGQTHGQMDNIMTKIPNLVILAHSLFKYCGKKT